MERAYTVAEIDRMRDAVWRIMGLTYTVTAWPAPDPQRDAAQNAPSQMLVENRLRTYMLAGTSPEEIEAEAAKSPDPFDAPGNCHLYVVGG